MVGPYALEGKNIISFNPFSHQIILETGVKVYYQAIGSAIEEKPIHKTIKSIMIPPRNATKTGLDRYTFLISKISSGVKTISSVPTIAFNSYVKTRSR